MKIDAVSGARVEAVRSLSNWGQLIEERLALFGHRNWIVVADAAYPAQSRPGIETILSGESQQTVLELLFARLRACRHVRPLIHLDHELEFIAEQDAPGVDHYRKWLHTALKGQNVNQAPHEEIIAKLDQAAQMFSVLIVKTDTTIPYTSIFFELDCGYWDDVSERRLRAAIRDKSEPQPTS
jgi:hypothetical protein